MNRTEQLTNPELRPWKSVRGLRGRMVLTAVGGVMLMSAVAWGQGAKKEEPPLDVNAVQPTEKKEASPAKAGEQPKAGEASGEVKPPPGPNADAAFDGERYAVSRFVLEYKSEHPEHVPLEELSGAVVTLGVTPGGYVEPREGMPTVQVRVGDVVEGAGGSFYRSGLNTVAKGIAGILTSRGYIGHFVEFHPEDIDPSTAEDKRGGKRTELRLRVWTGKASMVRTISSGERLQAATKSDPALRINSDDPVHARIRAQTPVEEGALLRKDRLDEYVFRLNRHPGRHVDVALSPGENDEEVVVDYLVAEGKPWSAYAQLSNTGTKSTEQWRERFGFVHNQLSGHDDILRVDYTTAGFSASHALVTSYDFPVWSDRIRIRPYFTYTKFEASDVGQAAATFTGETYAGGAEVTGTIYQRGAFFVDAMAGMRIKNESISNQFGGEGDEVFWIPYVGLSASRDTESMSTSASLTLEVHPSDWGDTDPTGVQLLGRPQVDQEWQVLKFFAEHSFYVEPLINPRGFKGEQSAEGPKTLAHEILLSVRGQYGFDNRLLASEEDVAGGMFTVRGYPESVVAGDTLVIGSAEYRFHVPRAWGVSEPGKLMGKDVGWFGGDFRWQPQQDFGRADWDWVLKAFVDVAQSRVNDKVIGEEDYTLVGVGVGTEVQWKRNLTMRLEWGVALKEISDPANPVDSGDNEVHFLITVLY